MRYYIFPGGTLKITDSTPLASFIDPEAIGDFKEVNLAVFYKLRLQGASKKAAANVKTTYKVGKQKATAIKDAIKK